MVRLFAWLSQCRFSKLRRSTKCKSDLLLLSCFKMQCTFLPRKISVHLIVWDVLVGFVSNWLLHHLGWYKFYFWTFSHSRSDSPEYITWVNQLYYTSNASWPKGTILSFFKETVLPIFQAVCWEWSTISVSSFAKYTWAPTL